MNQTLVLKQQDVVVAAGIAVGRLLRGGLTPSEGSDCLWDIQAYLDVYADGMSNLSISESQLEEWRKTYLD